LFIVATISVPKPVDIFERGVYGWDKMKRGVKRGRDGTNTSTSLPEYEAEQRGDRPVITEKAIIPFYGI
jgi:hypothetical protein